MPLHPAKLPQVPMEGISRLKFSLPNDLERSVTVRWQGHAERPECRLSRMTRLLRLPRKFLVTHKICQRTWLRRQNSYLRCFIAERFNDERVVVVSEYRYLRRSFDANGKTSK